MVEKIKNLFVVTLDNGKKTYFDFVDGKIYGVSGKAVQNFNAEAKKILKSEQENNFLAMYFCERTLAYPTLTGVRDWSTGMVETIYSLYASRYSAYVLSRIAEFCYKNHYELDKRGVKILTEALRGMENADGELNSLASSVLKDRITELTYGYLPAEVIGLISCASSSIKDYIVEDAKKIAFRYEHENWDYLEDSRNYWGGNRVYPYVARYIQLCNLLHHERTYKNLYGSICMMEKEKALMADKLCVEYQQNAPLFFEDENFTILIPTTADEFRKEADYQQNCVFRMYYPRVKDYSTHVVFIRKKSDIDTPYITCEVSNCGNIIQYLTRFNRDVADDDAIAFKVAYQKFLHEHF